VVRTDRVPRVFHATWSAQWRRYVYLFPLRITTSDGTSDGDTTSDIEACEAPGGCPGCLRKGWLAHADAAAVDAADADPKLVHAMLAALQGRAVDYSAFARDTPKNQPSVCTLHVARATVVELPGSGSGSGDDSPAQQQPGRCGRRRALCVELVGDRFLRKMVRVLVSTALREATPGAAVSAAARGGASQGSGGAENALLELAAMNNRLATAVPAPAVGLSFVAVGGSEYFD
jgi:tRNA U38,U39,U40 pseudouridine synthase TruA